MSTPGAVMSGLRMFGFAKLGPRDEKSAITGATTAGGVAGGLMVPLAAAPLAVT